ncbi:spore coat protein SP96-like [Saccostrea echinata]|uniref:spore coat protein SP96-like n=1 Tax=Saccostrea echinata TaxID=191078 RepID=UPI002A7F1EED|nr:spore coat protein SP96-like [Saccostrea echinata]
MIFIFLISVILLFSGAESQARCPRGNPLRSVFCGRGPNRQDCPSGYYCEIDPADRFAICCPQCPRGGQPLPGVFCGDGPNYQPCPYGYECSVHEVDLFAVCCPRSKNVPDKRCRSGFSLRDFYCGRGGRRCPRGYSCNIHPSDRYAICCVGGYRG